MVIFSISAGRMRIYRRIRGRVDLWREVVGTQHELDLAKAAALDLNGLVVGAGGWTKALGLGLDAVKPVESTGVAPGVLRHDRLDSHLGKL